MSKKRLPYLKWFASDFAGATRGWPFVARALYRELLDAQWDMGGLPADEAALRRVAGVDTDEVWSTAWPVVRPKFERCDDGLLRNPRLEQERELAAASVAKRAEAGKKGAAARWTDREPFP